MQPVKELPLTTLTSVILSTIPLAFLWSYLKRYVDRHGAFKWAETMYDTHNFLVASISIVIAAYVLDIGHDLLTVRTGYQVEPELLGYLYHLLKIYEYFDIVLAILSGTTRISKYTAFTHLFMPYWSFYRVICNDALDWRFQVIADCTVRFLSRAVPWLVEDLETEEIVLSVAEEWRWYPDLAISAFWATFMFQDTRTSEHALKAFGPPGDDEVTGRLLALGIMLYASYAKRQDDARKKHLAATKDPKRTSKTVSSQESAPTESIDTAQASQRLKKKR